MIIQGNAQKTVTNVSDSTSFGIQNSGKMFKMIISGLYSKKAESITREIWSNAFDAHCMKGTPERPFEVTLPSTFRPEFKVRDFGEGLSHDWMKRNYTIMGHSSKENTNIAVGKWGVGRMSPMSYTDTFSVVSRHKGYKTTYNVTMEETGEPQLNVLIPPMKTDEEDGLEISFPVSRSDFGSFTEAARRVALGFEVKPAVVGNKDFLWNTLETKTAGNGYGTYTVKGHSSLYGVVAKMGCVIYPINLRELKLTPTEESTVRGMDLILDVPIGSVEVTASREDLSYGSKEPTVDYLTGRIKVILKELVKDTQAQLDKIKTEYERFMFLKDCGLHPSLKNMLTVDGEPVKNYSYSIPDGVSCFVKDYNKASKKHLTSCTRTVNAIFVAHKNGPKHDVRAESRVRHWTCGNGNTLNTLTLLVYKEWDKESRTYDETNVDKLEPYFGKALVRDLSSIPDVTPVKRKESKAKVYTLDWDEAEVDMDEGGYYVKSYMSRCQFSNGRLRENLLKESGAFKGKTVVIVPKTLWKKFESHDDWSLAEDYFESWVDSNKSKLIKGFQNSGVTDTLNLSGYKGLFKGPIKEYYEILDSVEDIGISPYYCGEVLGACKVNLSGVKLKSDKLDKIVVEVYKRYPLLGELRYRRTCNKDTAEYVLAMDSFRGYK